MKKILLALLCVSSVSSFAESPVYIDANIGLNTSWSSTALNADVGYMFNRYFGIEGGLTYSSGYNYNYGPYSWSTNYWMLDGAVKGVLPLSDVFALYGKLGLGLNNYTSSWSGCPGCGSPSYSGSNLGVFVGVGGQFNLSRDWSLHLEDYTTTGANPNMFMFGAQYNF